MIISEKLSTPNYEWQRIDYGASGFVIFTQLLLIFLLMTECRIIKIDEEKIKYINPVLPFIRKTKFFNEYDYMQTVLEYSRGGYYEAIWLIKNEKLKDRISSFYYSNYSELKNGIKVNNKGMLKINKFKQIACLMGMSIR